MRKRHYFIGITGLIAVVTIGFIIANSLKSKWDQSVYERRYKEKLQKDSTYAANPQTIPWDTISDSDLGWIQMYTATDTGKIRLLTTQMQKRAVRADLLTDRAEQYNNIGKYDSALADVDRAIRLSPNEGRSYSVRMQIMLNLKDTVEAKNSLNEFKRFATVLDYTQLELFELKLLECDSALVQLERDFQNQWKSAEPYDTLSILGFAHHIWYIKGQLQTIQLPEPYKSKWEKDFSKLYQKYENLIPKGMRK